MIFDKRMAYDINPLSLPRLSPYENYSSIDVLVRKINEDTGVIRFSNLLDFARSQDIDLITAGNTLCEEYGLRNYITIVNEEKFYRNNSYRQSILESYKEIPMQMEYVDYDVLYYNLLEQAILEDIYYNTNTTDILLETGVVNFNNDLNYTLSHTQDTASDIASSFKDKLVQGLLISPIKGVLNLADKHLTPEQMDKVTQTVSQKTENMSQKVGAALVRGGKNGVKTSVKPYLKGAAAAAVVGGGLYTLNRQINNLTNPNNIKKKPNVIRRILNSLKRILSSLFSRRKASPPQQQGIISRLISKVKNSIEYLTRKIGLSNNNSAYVEDFNNFSSNKLTQVILEDNLDPYNTGIAIDEIKILDNPHTLSKIKKVINPSNIYIHPADTVRATHRIQEGINEFIENQDWGLFDNYLTEDFDNSSKIMSQIGQNMATNMKKGASEEWDKTKKEFKNDVTDFGKKAAIFTGGLYATNKILDRITKRYAENDSQKPRSLRSKLLADLRVLRNKLHFYEVALTKGPSPQKRSLLGKIIYKIKSAISSILHKLGFSQ